MSTPYWSAGDPMPADLQSATAWLEERALQRGYQLPAFAGVSVGGCAVAHGSTTYQGAMRNSAHAHTANDGDLTGWLCFKAHGLHALVSATGLPTLLFRHEYAHLLAPSDHGHGTSWRRAVTALGAPAEAARYVKRAADRRARRANTVWYVQVGGVQVTMTDAQYRQHVRDKSTQGY